MTYSGGKRKSAGAATLSLSFQRTIQIHLKVGGMFWKNFKKGGGYCIIKGSVLEVMLAVRSARDACRMEKGAKETFGKDGKKEKSIH